MQEFFDQNSTLLRGGGFQGMKFVKHDFEIMVDPKGTLNGATLGYGFENPNP